MHKLARYKIGQEKMTQDGHLGLTVSSPIQLLIALHMVKLYGENCIDPCRNI